MNVLVTCGGGFQGLALYKDISMVTGVQSFVTDINETHLTQYLFDNASLCPLVAEKEKYTAFLHHFCSENNIQYIFPATAIDTVLLASLKTKWKTELGCDIMVPDADVLQTLSDKKSALMFFREAGVIVQPEMDPLDDSNYPVIGKSRSGWGGKGVVVFKSVDAYKKSQYTNNADYIWLKFIPSFIEYSVDFSISIAGEMSKPITRKRDFVSGGFAIVSSVVDDAPKLLKEELKKIKNIFSTSSFSGIYNVQFLTGDDFCFLSDINPRIGTSAVAGPMVGKSLTAHAMGIEQNDIAKTNGNSSPVFFRTLEERVYQHINLEKVKNIVFDLDDTLISNRSFILDRCSKLYQKTSNRFQLGEHITFMQACGMILTEGKAPVLIDELCRKYDLSTSKDELLSAYRQCMPEKLKVYRDVQAVLNNLRKKGFKLFVLTDNPVVTQQKKWELFPYAGLFNGIVFSESIKSQKPSKDAFNELPKTGGGNADEYVMVGDNFYRDSLGAIDAGFAAAFHIHRTDGLVSGHFDPSINTEKIIPVNSLTDLRFYFNS